MMILHAGFCGTSFVLWAETGEAAQSGAATEAAAGDTFFAQSARSPELGQLLRALGLHGPALPERFHHAWAWLPTLRSQPLGSETLFARAGGQATAPLQPWKVTTLRLGGRMLLPLLRQCRQPGSLLAGHRIGHDLLWWATLVRFAGALAARQMMVPGVIGSGSAVRSQWRACPWGPEADRWQGLLEAMPPVAACLTETAIATPELNGLAAARLFLDACVDELVRGAAAARPHEFGAPRRLQAQWLASLHSGDAVLAGNPRELDAFTRQVEEWQSPVSDVLTSPFRLCIRLEEPAADEVAAQPDEPWRLSYLLQDLRDASQLYPAATIWSGEASARLASEYAAAKGQLTALLGQAARLSSAVADSLREPAPDSVPLSLQQAWQFLAEAAPALRQNGFVVQLPAWWTRANERPRLRLRALVAQRELPRQQSLTSALLNVRWQLALEGNALTEEELQRLAAHPTPLVKLRGQWVEFDPRMVGAWLERLRPATRQLSVGELLRLHLGGEHGAGEQLEVRAPGWIGHLLQQVDGDERWQPLPAPPALQATLRPYQERGFSWLVFLRALGLGACLADDMGLGKTIQTLAALQEQWTQGERRPSLLICPTSVLGNWMREAQRFTPELPVLAWHGAQRPRAGQLQAAVDGTALVLTTYGLLQRGIDDLVAIPWAAVILDEAQNIKNPASRQARAARRLRAGHRIALTGTPVENHVGELWSLMEFLNPGLLGSREGFLRAWQIPIQAGDREAAGRLRRLVAPFLLRRLKTDPTVISDLPEKLEMKVFCPISREQAGLYKAVLKDLERELEAAEGMERRGLILAALTRLKQICNHPAHFLKQRAPLSGRSGKLLRLEEMIEEVLASGEAALIFTQFSAMGELLQAHLQQRFREEVLFLDGQVPQRERERRVERFQSPDGPRLFVLSLKAGGTGLNLVRACHVFHFDRWWNPAVENQATDRAFRIGQSQRVQVRMLICQGTLEERIDALIEHKRTIAGSIIGDGEQWLTELSAGELRDLIALSREAMEEM